MRRGRFRLGSHGRRTTIDPTNGYLHPPGHEARFAHPAGGDACTCVTLLDETLTTGIGDVRARVFRVDARLEFAHRRLLRAAADQHFTAVDSIVTMLQLALRRHPDERPAPGRYELADRARDAILADDPSSASLVGLAARLGTSASHLSRTFRHHTGMSISRYRNRVRISRSLRRMDEGESDLASLAVDLGFSDQAHFTRVMRAELGHTPGRALALLGPRR